MERLTIKNNNWYHYSYCFREDTCGGVGYSNKCDKCDFSYKVCEKLGRLEDLADQGRLLELPCAVGDTRKKCMSRVLPILFNTEMVRAILDGRKTVTRRVVKYKYSNTEMRMRTDKYGSSLIEIQKNIEGETWGKNPDGSTWRKLLAYIEKEPPYKKGDILYVRETWAFIPCIGCNGDYIRDGGPLNCYDYQAVEYDDGDNISDGCFQYRADCRKPERITWRPSIHMPKQAARIWLKVTDVRVERLKDISTLDCEQEGIDIGKCSIFRRFAELWDSTIKEKDIYKYGWKANPWVWVTRFERCEKPESEV